MRILKISFAVLILLALVPSNSILVQAAEPVCESAALYEQASALKSSGDAKQDLTDLITFADAIHQANISCNGMRFEGKTNKAIGTIEIPAGTWLVTLTTKSAFFLYSDVLEGECEVYSSIFTVSNDEAADSISTVIKSEGCRVLLTLDHISSEYVLTFELVK